ncbi:MAG: M48 family metalloprotease [Armatimonas sp.]
MKRFTALVALGVLAIPVLAQTPAPPPKEDPDITLGKQSHEELLKGGMKLIADPELQKRIDTIGQKMAVIVNKEVIKAQFGVDNTVPFTYKFHIVDDKDINAFSLPGGYLYFNKGLLNYVQSDDELAGVMGHEMIHAAHRHVAKLMKEQNKLNTQMALGALAAILAKVPQQDTGNLLQGFQLVALQKVSGHSQNAERDADNGGIQLAMKAGYNPVGMLTFMERLERDRKLRPDIDMGIFRTHPPEKERATNMIKQLTALGLPINRRETTQMLKVSVQQGTGAPTVGSSNVQDVLIDGKLFFRTTSAERAKSVAQTLDKALDKPLQLYDITRRGSSVLVRGQNIVTIEASDVPGTSTDTQAETATKNLRNALYRYILEGVY